MELDDFMVVVTMLSLLIGLCGLLLNLTNRWAHKPETIVVEAEIKLVDPANEALDKKIGAMNKRLFGGKHGA